MTEEDGQGLFQTLVGLFIISNDDEDVGIVARVTQERFASNERAFDLEKNSALVRLDDEIDASGLLALR